MLWADYLVRYGDPNFTYGRVETIPKWTHYPPKNLTHLKITQIYDLWYPFHRVPPSDHFGMSIFETFEKLTECHMRSGFPIFGKSREFPDYRDSRK